MNADENASGSNPSVTDERSNLCASDEICLAAFIDGECGWFRKIIAKRILGRSYEARRFVNDLERTSEQFEQRYNSEINPLREDVSLWTRISARIAQEERLTLLRSIPLETSQPFPWIARLSWSGFGAVAASLLMLVYLPVGQSSGNSEIASSGSVSPIVVSRSAVSEVRNVNQKADPAGIANAESILQNVSLRDGPVSLRDGQGEPGLEEDNSWKFLQESPQFLDSEKSRGLSLSNQRRVIAPQVFEVDWMRSYGRVRVLQDASGKAGIIWVNRPTRTLVASNNNLKLPLSQSSPRAQSGNLYATSVGNR